MKSRILLLSGIAGTLILAACTSIDTTGLSDKSNRGPHPKTSAAASVVVTEFGDLQCPACRAAQPIVQAIIEKYQQRIRFDFKHFPLQQIHPYTMQDAEASECAADQGKFWEYEELAYEKQPDLSSQSITDWAKQLKLDMSLFERCTGSHIKKAEILADYDEGVKLGVNGTPTFFVNGQKVESTVDGLSTAIDAALKSIDSIPL